MRIAGAPKCASTPSVVSAFQYGSESERGLTPNPTPTNCTPLSGSAAVFRPHSMGYQTGLQDETALRGSDDGGLVAEVSRRLVGQPEETIHDRHYGFGGTEFQLCFRPTWSVRRNTGAAEGGPYLATPARRA